MPEIQYNMIRKSSIQSIIGKAKKQKIVLYLIKWKPEQNRQISWVLSIFTLNQIELIKNFNSKISNQELPYIDPQFKQFGFKLLKQLSQNKKIFNRMWKIEKILGKRLLNGKNCYFIKFKNKSIFQSNWIKSRNLRLNYGKTLQKFDYQIKNLSLPYIDRERIQEYIEMEKVTFLNNLVQLDRIYENFHHKKTKKELNQIKKRQKGHLQVKQQKQLISKVQKIQLLIDQLWQRLQHPVVNNTYLQSKYDKLDEEQSQILYSEVKYNDTFSNTFSNSEYKQQLEPSIRQKSQVAVKQEQISENLPIIQFNIQQDEIKIQEQNSSETKYDVDSSFRQGETSMSTNNKYQKITRNLSNEKKTQRKHQNLQIISIKLVKTNITTISNKKSQGSQIKKSENLYEVIFSKAQQKSQTFHKSQQNEKFEDVKSSIKENKILLLTSYLKKYHNDEFVSFIESEINKLTKEKGNLEAGPRKK